MKSNKLLKGTLLLTLFGFTGKALGALFRIGLVNIVGASGMGIYGLIFPLFVFFTLLSSEGFSLGLTTSVAKNKLTGKIPSYKKYAFISILSLSILSALVIIVLSPTISSLQGGTTGSLLYVAVALCVVVVSLLGYLKAVIRGSENVKLYSSVEIVEDLSKVVFALIGAYFLKPYGVEYSVIGVFIGIALSTTISIIVALIGNKNKCRGLKTEPLTQAERTTFFKFALFSSLAALVVPAIQFIDSVLVIKLLSYTGLTAVKATTLFGLSRGSVSAILNLPTFLLTAFEFLLLPVLTRAENGDYAKKTSNSLVLSFFISVPFFLFFNLFAQEIITILYGSALTSGELVVASRLLKIGSISIVFSAFCEIMIVGLEAKGNSVVPLVSSLIAGGIKIVFMIILVPKISIYAVELSSVLFCMIECLIVFIYAKHKKMFLAPKFIVRISLIWFLVFFVAKGLIMLLKMLFPSIVAFIIGGIICFVIIAVSCFIVWRKNKGKNKVINEIFNID